MNYISSNKISEKKERGDSCDHCEQKEKNKFAKYCEEISRAHKQRNNKLWQICTWIDWA